MPIRVDAQGLDVARLASGRRRPRVVYVTPAHQFPTGAVLPLARRLALLAWARRQDAYVIEDDYDSEYRYAGAPIETLHGLDRGGRVFHVGSFSKILSPALRLGYLVVPPAVVRPATIARTAADLGSATAAGGTLGATTSSPPAISSAPPALATPSRGSARRAARGDRRASRRDRAVRGGAAGLHVMLEPRVATAGAVERLVRRAAAHGVGVYSTTGLHLRRPRRSALLLGHGALSEGEIRTGIGRLAEVMTR